MIYVFSDGSSLTANGIGGWAYAVIEGLIDPFQIKLLDKCGDCVKDAARGYKKTTNNRMEMAAANEGMQYVADVYGVDQDLTLVTDSKYVIDGITKWRKNWEQRDFRGSAGPVKNKDIWIQLFETVDSFEGELQFKHVRGHQGFYWNEHVDKLARAAADSIREQQSGW